MEKADNPYQKGQVLLIDKPLNWTSFDVVNKIRYAIKTPEKHKIKVGHAGTLDPLATGLLILCTGKFTKRINEYMGLDKEYTGTFYLGAVTPTYDLESEPTDFKDISGLTNTDIEKTKEDFTGIIQQIPPIHSAVKKKGKKAYELARKGKEVKLDPKTVEIKEFEITRIAFPEIDVRIKCSKGTYIRSLANDFGSSLGCGAYLSKLRRTKIGNCTIEDASDIKTTIAHINEQLRTDIPPQN